jgi:hypothetical protein
MIVSCLRMVWFALVGKPTGVSPDLITITRVRLGMFLLFFFSFFFYLGNMARLPDSGHVLVAMFHQPLLLPSADEVIMRGSFWDIVISLL